MHHFNKKTSQTSSTLGSIKEKKKVPNSAKNVEERKLMGINHTGRSEIKFFNHHQEQFINASQILPCGIDRLTYTEKNSIL